MNLSTVTMITTNDAPSVAQNVVSSERTDDASQGQSFDRVLASTMSGNQQTGLKKEQAPEKNAQQTSQSTTDGAEAPDVAQNVSAADSVLQEAVTQNVAWHKNPKLATDDDSSEESATAAGLALLSGAAPATDKIASATDSADVDLTLADPTLTNADDATRQLMAMIQASQSPTAAPTAPIGEAVEQQAAIPALVSALPQAKTSTDQTDKSTLLSDGAEQKAQPAATSASGSSFTQRLAAQSDDAAGLANSNKALQQDVALSAGADDKTSFSSSSLRDGQSLAAHASVNSGVQQPIAASAQAPVTQTSASVAPVVTAQINAQLGSDEWQQAVSQQVIMFSRNGQQTAELRLHPQELGSLQISLKLDDNQAQIHLVSANSQVRAAMEAALPHLRTSMAESGINLGQASVGSDASSGWQQQAQQQSEGSGAGSRLVGLRDGADLAGASTGQSPTVASVVSVAGGVDIFA